MPTPSPLPMLSCKCILPSIMTVVLLAASRLPAATIQLGNVTTELGPSFLVDEAATGGSDITVDQPNVASYNRSFAGLLTANQGSSRITLTGFGFATSTSTVFNDATSLTVTFTYLGADEAVGGGDDVLIGSATGTYAYTTNGEYVFAFDSPMMADLAITGVRFRIQIAPSNAASNGSVLFKTGTLAYETTTGPKFSVAGFVTPQRVNLAKWQPVATDSVSGQRLASYVTDGNAGNDNRWQSNGSAPHWAQVTFPYPVEVGSAQVFSGVDDGSALTAFTIQYLDGLAWVNAPGGAVTGNTSVERTVGFTTPVTSTSFRIYDSADGTMRIREFALYPPAADDYPTGTDVTINLARQRPVTATAHTAGNFALLAVDGRVNEASKWQTSTAGDNSLEIDLRASIRIGSAHLYSGSSGVAPLTDFQLGYWDGSAWQDIPGGSVTGNAAEALAISFTTPVTTSKVRLEFTNSGTTSVRELSVFPANDANAGYPIGTGVTGLPPLTAKFDDYRDAFYTIDNAAASESIAVSGGVMVLNPSGLALENRQYQILLNIDAGTYRLRNRATGLCLSGARLSKTPGLPLVDAPYAALPDQDWIVAPAGGTGFFLINQWSGLVIDTQGGATAAGTPLVQAANTGAATQCWQFTYSTHFPKKGIGGAGDANTFDGKWAYNWGLATSNILPAGSVFNPMQWGNYNWSYDTTANSIWKLYPAWRTRGDSLHVMGFNEPDHWDQSGNSLDLENTSEADFSPTRSMNTAVTLWPRLMAMDQPLVAPCPANMTGGWLADFYTQAGNLGYRVDYTPNHSYQGPNGGSSDNLISNLQNGYNTWGRPMWMTEFGFVDWGGNSSWSEEDNYNCLAEFLWRAESLPWLHKYALFVFTEDENNPQPANPWQNFTPAPRSNSRDINGNLTAFGKLYAAWDGDANVRTNKDYCIHNKNTRKRLASVTSQSNPGARNIRTDGALVDWNLVAAPTNGRYYIVSKLDGRRLGSDGANVSLVAAGTIGSAVEWTLTEKQYGWFYLGHPASSKRLKMVYNNSGSYATYSMVGNTSTGDDVQWRFIVQPVALVWSGVGGSAWSTAGSWIPGLVPSAGDAVAFTESSVVNLGTDLDQDFDLAGVSVTSPAGQVSISGSHALTIGPRGIDLSSATQDLTVSIPLVLSADQTWSVSTNRTLAVNGGISGAFALSLTGAGTVSLGAAVDSAVPVTIANGTTLKTDAANVLPGAGTVNGTLDLNGTAQSVNSLDGAGVIDNTSTGAATLTVGNNDTVVTLLPTLRNTSGALALVKTDSSSLTLPVSNTFSGGFTNNGTGWIYPKDNTAFGSGPVVMNGATIYSTAGSYTFSNTLVLNGANLRVGGSNNRTITWNGPVTVTGSSGITSDGGTAGITINGPVNIAGATFTSNANGTTHNINGVISGAGGNLVVTGGTLQLAGANTHTGTATISNGAVLRLQPSGTIPGSTPIVINGSSSNLNIRNTVGWVHAGAITGDGLGQINLNSGTNATLAGNISGVSNINANSPGTDATISGAICGAANVSIQSSVDANGLGAVLRLGGPNSYSGATTISRGSLVLATDNVLPDTTPVSIGDATLDAATFTDTAGTLDVSNTATLHLGTGAALAFAASNAVDWTGGTLEITGQFVSGSSLRFGSNNSGLTPTQLALISADGFGSFALDSNGYLTATATGGYPSWAAVNAPSGGPTDDYDGDGVCNALEYVLGGDTNSNDLARLPQVSSNGENLIFSFKRDQRSIDGSTTLTIESGVNLTNWPTAWPVPDVGAANNPGVTVIKDSPAGFDEVTLTIPRNSGSRQFVRLKVVMPP